MTENVTEPKQEVAETATINENVEVTTITENVEPNTDVQKTEVKHTPRRRSKKTEATATETEVKQDVSDNIELVVEPNSELEAMKAELEAMKAEKAKLEEERNVLNDTVTKLQEEVKITPKKLGMAIQQLGIAPMAVNRDVSSMTLEAYNSMTDTARREWQRTHRSEYLQMMHNVKLR